MCVRTIAIDWTTEFMGQLTAPKKSRHFPCATACARSSRLEKAYRKALEPEDRDEAQRARQHHPNIWSSSSSRTGSATSRDH